MSEQWKFLPANTPIAANKLQQLVVVTCISNPVRYASRYRLYRQFEEVMRAAGATLITVEMAFGERPFEITERDNPLHVQLRSIDELWHKENMINIGINYARQVFPDSKYFAWIDADVLPMRPAREWLEETVQQLQHYHVVQMFETAIDLDPNHNMLGQPQTSFMCRYTKSGFVPPKRGGFWKDYYSEAHGHPGYAWAATREALDAVGGLIDFAILGAGDRHMALGLVGCMDQSFEALNPTYRRYLLQWQERAERWIKRDVGYVKGSIYHFFHGRKRERFYESRWKILKDNDYDPATDIKKDSQGLYQLETWEPRQIRLRDQLRAYSRSRNEDSIDIE
jgi:hypothetical protein